MKTKDIAKQYGIDQEKFENYLLSVEALKFGFTGYHVDDNKVAEYVELFKEDLVRKEAEAQAAAEAARVAAEEAERKQRALSSMLISSGFAFDGYKITKYSGYISGDDCATIPRDSFWGERDTVATNLCDSLVSIRRQAIKELKEAAYDLGCNAVVGVDFDYITMDPQHASASGYTVYEPYVICVTANGNAVVVEKE